MLQTKISQLTLPPKQAYRIFKRAIDLADALEDIIETQGIYSKEFISGLQLSFKQAKQGKLGKIKSLKDLK